MSAALAAALFYLLLSGAEVATQRSEHPVRFCRSAARQYQDRRHDRCWHNSDVEARPPDVCFER